MPHGWKVTKPRDDAEYFERMTKSIFTAGLNWEVVEKKWPSFRKAFSDFAPAKVAKISGAQVKALMGDPGIVRNERKIAANREQRRRGLEAPEGVRLVPKVLRFLRQG